ncbi:hypothetical protein [Subtercola boreus]|uniref:Transposase n=1 Tax=Subtercola boreus TaxID=120213 RepID=A0A3E0WF33_9MICO|nr:hypothetical protein [Subtercola boreus]RFA22638.1 hypothetical protein B7R24_03210 [Subtercola boreus]RFA22994.1 hypothetical protein B7R23_03205 [Subtercola boreus]RFA28745.1 hypothetical protein B7R25_03220 [Subtercola boreus]
MTDPTGSPAAKAHGLSDDTALQREHRRAVAAEAALAELRRRFAVLELRNRELSGILDALSRRGRLESSETPVAPETPAAEEHAE